MYLIISKGHVHVWTILLLILKAIFFLFGTRNSSMMFLSLPPLYGSAVPKLLDLSRLRSFRVLLSLCMLQEYFTAIELNPKARGYQGIQHSLLLRLAIYCAILCSVWSLCSYVGWLAKQSCCKNWTINNIKK